MYFNTTNEVNPQLEVFHKKAESQDNVIETLFSENPLKAYTPSEVWQLLIKRGIIGVNTPLTSIRRSMNTLTKKDLLIKTDTKKTGIYNRKEHVWVLTIEQNHT